LFVSAPQGGNVSPALAAPDVRAYYLVNGAVWKRLRLPAIHFRPRPLWQQASAFIALIFVHPFVMVRSTLLR
jgi:hypothetical protein